MLARAHAEYVSAPGAAHDNCAVVTIEAEHPDLGHADEQAELVCDGVEELRLGDFPRDQCRDASQRGVLLRESHYNGMRFGIRDCRSQKRRELDEARLGVLRKSAAPDAGIAPRATRHRSAPRSSNGRW